MLAEIRLDAVVGVVTAVWFFVAGVSKLPSAKSAGRRSVPVSTLKKVVRRLRGIVEMLLALTVAATIAAAAFEYPVPSIGLWLGLALSSLGLWTAVESFVPPLRPVRIIFAVLGFALAVFYAGFR